MLSDKELYEIAKKRVDDKRGFKIHLTIYLIFSIIVMLSDFNREFIIPILVWGVGIGVHAMSLYSTLNSENAIQKELKKMKNKKL